MPHLPSHDASQAQVCTFFFTSTYMLRDAFLALAGGVLIVEQTTSSQSLAKHAAETGASSPSAANKPNAAPLWKWAHQPCLQHIARHSPSMEHAGHVPPSPLWQSDPTRWARSRRRSGTGTRFAPHEVPATGREGLGGVDGVGEQSSHLRARALQAEDRCLEIEGLSNSQGQTVNTDEGLVW